MADLGEKVAQVEGLVDKRLKFLGLRFTYTSLVAAFALISTIVGSLYGCLLYTSPSPRDATLSRMPSSA